MSKRKLGYTAVAISLFLFAAGCKKKTAIPAPPPPPPPKAKPAPPKPKPVIASFTAEPSTIERGQSSKLSWSVSDATEVRITPGIGTVSARDSRQVYPSSTTTYTLSATGPGGSAQATTTVTVNVPPPPPPPPKPQPPKKTLTERLTTEVQDVYFDYDKSEVREDARATLSRNSDGLKAILNDFPGATVLVEGHCDERGSAEYNLGLGDRRATSAKEYLVQMGVPADKLKTVSYGKERPQCTESNEACWQKNRRAHFSAGQ